MQVSNKIKRFTFVGLFLLVLLTIVYIIQEDDTDDDEPEGTTEQDLYQLFGVEFAGAM